MPKPPKKGTASRKLAKQIPDKRRLWLMYPQKLIRTPIIWELSQKYKIIPNVRQVSVTDEIGVVCLELEGLRSEIQASIKWLERKGIRVEPVEINVIES